MLSIIIPFHNEEKNLELLHKEICDTLSNIKINYEIIFINDGSTDQSANAIKNIALKDKQIVALDHKFKMGKGRALSTGIKNAKGETIIFMDADLQDDPQYIPQFIKKIEEGFDFINGARLNRKENILIKTYTNLANYLLKLMLKSPFSDINCGFKVMRKSIFDEIILYGNNFRFLPLGAFYRGFKVTEIQIQHRVRKFGKSKYGINKIFIGIADFFTANFLYNFSERPLHFFGLIGGVFFIIGFIIALYLSIERIFFQVLLYRRPILFFAILLIIVGIQIVMTGIIGELIVYVNKKNK